MPIPLPADVREVIDINERPAPMGLPPKVAEARRFAHWGKLAFLLMALIFLMLAGWEMMTMMFWHHGYFPIGIFYYGIAMLVAFVGAYMTQTTIVRLIDQGRFSDARNSTLIWMILGFIFGVLPGLMLLLAFINLDETTAPAPPPPVQAPQPAQVQPAQPYVPPPPPPTPSSPKA